MESPRRHIGSEEFFDNREPQRQNCIQQQFNNAVSTKPAPPPYDKKQ
jgi:hypothetical protein